jgi:hypothetical protein
MKSQRSTVKFSNAIHDRGRFGHPGNKAHADFPEEEATPDARRWALEPPAAVARKIRLPVWSSTAPAAAGGDYTQRYGIVNEAPEVGEMVWIGRGTPAGS